MCVSVCVHVCASIFREIFKHLWLNQHDIRFGENMWCAVIQHRAVSVHQDMQSVNCEGGLISRMPSCLGGLPQALCLISFESFFYYTKSQCKKPNEWRFLPLTKLIQGTGVRFSAVVAERQALANTRVLLMLLLNSSRWFDLYWLLPVPTTPNNNVLHIITPHLWLYHNCTTSLWQQD